MSQEQGVINMIVNNFNSWLAGYHETGQATFIYVSTSSSYGWFEWSMFLIMFALLPVLAFPKRVIVALVFTVSIYFITGMTMTYGTFCKSAIWNVLTLLLFPYFLWFCLGAFVGAGGLQRDK